MTQAEEKTTDNLEHRPVVGPSGRKIVYDKDGKPCRSCNSLLDFKLVMGTPKPPAALKQIPPVKAVGAATVAAITSASDSGEAKSCPPDVEELGRSSWTLLHAIAATYPSDPSETQQSDLKQFVKLFGNFYPCWFCASDFKKYTSLHEPKVGSQDEFGKWLCDAHNDVNKKLGKKEFDCNLWKQRWKDGWEDGSCD